MKLGKVIGRSVVLSLSSGPRKLEDPSGSKKDRYVMTVNLPSLPLEKIPSDPNPRNHTDLKSSKLSGLRDSILENSGNFVFKNLGITILAEKTEYNAKTNEITIHLGENGGISNGNTTLNYCQEYGRESYNEHVLITVFTNIVNSDDILQMAEGQNTSVNVDRVSLLHYNEEFSKIEEMLKEFNVLDKVFFKQNDKRDIDVKYLIRALVATNPSNTIETQIKSYTSSSSCIEEYMNNKTDYDKFIKNLEHVMILNDSIKKHAKSEYNNLTKGKAGSLKFFSDSNDKRVFFQESVAETISDSVFFSVLGAYQGLFEVTKNGSRLKPEVANIGVEEIVKDTIGILIDKCRSNLNTEFNYNLNAFGKSKMVWETLSVSIERYLNKKLV